MKNKFKKGAASFYIVAFSTLILMIVAISFATVIISEVERTSNDDLSQSAYDSALAGVEDAKLAYYNYQNCLAQDVTATKPVAGGSVTCGEILWYVNEANTLAKASSKTEDDTKMECSIVWKILGKDETMGGVSGEVVEVKNGVNNNMQQATTCVAMTDESDDYRGTLSASSMVDVIKLSFVDGVSANDITKIKLSWFSKDDAAKVGTLTYKSGFPALSVPVAAPPVVSLTVLQTGEEFTLDSFSQVVDGEQTNRGTLYFTPKLGDGTGSSFGKSALTKSNNKASKNTAQDVNCAKDMDSIDEFACSATVDLPKPIGGTRSDDTFEVIVSLPYGQPTTEFAVELYKNDTAAGAGSGGGSSDEVATMKGVQVTVDSTGRANDLYRRVQIRLKNKNELALSVMGPLELLDSGDDTGMEKNLTVTKEYNFTE